MAWSTQHMQVMTRQMPDQFPDELLGQIARVAHAHINMRGIFSFNLGLHRKTLLGSEQTSAARKTAT
jgi:hypothetical protein